MEQQVEPLNYPRAIPFIISNEFCERFNYYGMRAILVLYLNLKLEFLPNTSTLVFHSFMFVVYLFCLIGAIIADSFLGKFKTILYLSIVYATGSTVVAIGAAVYEQQLAIGLSFVGLALIAIGSGGIKPCVAVFGGEQFKLPEQEKSLKRYFSMFYFVVNLGSFISTIVTPILREDVKCFDRDDCYSAGFGLPAILMALSLVIFISGKKLYNIVPSQGNMIAKVFKCICVSCLRMYQSSLETPLLNLPECNQHTKARERY